MTNIDFYLIVEVDKGAECWACLDCVIKALSVLSFSFHVLWFVSVIQSKKMEDWLVPSISFRLDIELIENVHEKNPYVD